MKPRCTPHKQSFTWALRGRRLHLSEPRASRWLAFEEEPGEVRAALVAALPGSDLAWLPVRTSPKVCARFVNAVLLPLAVEEGCADDCPPAAPGVFGPLPHVRELQRERAAVGFLARLSEAIGMTLRNSNVGDHFYIWRALVPTPMVHEQFGPGYAVASDGARVVLLSGAYFGCDWMLAHVTNVQRLPAGHSGGGFGAVHAKARAKLKELLDQV